MRFCLFVSWRAAPLEVSLKAQKRANFLRVKYREHARNQRGFIWWAQKREKREMTRMWGNVLFKKCWKTKCSIDFHFSKLVAHHFFQLQSVLTKHIKLMHSDSLSSIQKTPRNAKVRLHVDPLPSNAIPEISEKPNRPPPKTKNERFYARHNYVPLDDEEAELDIKFPDNKCYKCHECEKQTRFKKKSSLR